MDGQVEIKIEKCIFWQGENYIYPLAALVEDGKGPKCKMRTP